MLKLLRNKVTTTFNGKPGLTPLQAILVITFFAILTTIMFFTVH